MRHLESVLQEENPQFRRIWVGYSHNRIYRVVITLFPHAYGPYRMIFGEPRELSYESIREILKNNLDYSN